MFISVDGIDGAGKSTQMDLLETWLSARGAQVVRFRDPGATQLGEAVREILLHREEIPIAMRSEMLLYMAARAQLVDEQIRPSLESGKTVLCDRYLLANVVYQGCAGGLDIESLWEVGNIATGGLKPDVTIVFDLDTAIALQRVGTGQDRLEKRGFDYFQKVRQGFLDQVSRASTHSIVIDASPSLEVVHQRVTEYLNNWECCDFGVL
ncbi:MAG: dTMP kinase [Planctomycetota bacterium]|jgi:dTMP kinase|nr:dTMP kinase [Planctomycetota bacterium]